MSKRDHLHFFTSLILLTSQETSRKLVDFPTSINMTNGLKLKLYMREKFKALASSSQKV